MSVDKQMFYDCLQFEPHVQTHTHTCTYLCVLFLFAQVSKAAADLMAYCENHAKEDPLVTPVPSSENPFREKKLFCAIL